jgi:hypothetical protein
VLLEEDKLTTSPLGMLPEELVTVAVQAVVEPTNTVEGEQPTVVVVEAKVDEKMNAPIKSAAAPI